MRRTLLLLATTVALALLLVGGVATAKQEIDKGSGAIPRSTVVKASFANGSGANFLGVKVSDHGNLTSFESPAGQEQVFGGREGYAVCSNNGSTHNGHDTGDVEGGFAAPTFSQPNGAGTFPLTVTRRTTDGKFQLTQVWAKPDAVEKDITVTMTLKNISSATIEGVLMSRSGDFDVGDQSADRGAGTNDSVWLWDDATLVSPPGGLMLSALTFGTSHFTGIETASTWVGDGTQTNPGTRQSCGADRVNTPTSTASDLTMKVLYLFGNMSAGQSKSVKFEYGRM